MQRLPFRQIHLDFHTPEKMRDVCKEFDPEQFASTLKRAGVQYINCFAKCNHGMIYYDTKFPAKHPGLKRNLLKEQIEACHNKGIRAPVYINVGYDHYMAQRHPEWRSIDCEGNYYGPQGPMEPGLKRLCLNSPYVDYVKDQTVEILEIFGSELDGFWFDIVYQKPCCCIYCMEDMRKEGFNPELEKDRIEYAHKVTCRFQKDLTDLIRSYDTKCSIFYNKGHIGPTVRDCLDTYTHFELESVPSGLWDYEHLPITLRYIKKLGKEYAGMTVRFHKAWQDFGGIRSQAALECECFTSLAHGGKCSIGDHMHPSGVLNSEAYNLIGKVYKQVERKEPWCTDVSPVSEIGIVTPEIHKDNHRRLNPYIRGVYRILEESHYQFDVLDRYMDLNKYSVIILPDAVTLDETLKAKLENYVKGGGHLLLSYKSGMDIKEEKFILDGMGVTLKGDSRYFPDYITAGKKFSKNIYSMKFVMYEKGLMIQPARGTETLASIWNPYFNRDYNHFSTGGQIPPEKNSDYPAVTKKGNIIYFSHPVFEMYHKHGYKVYKQLVLNSLEMLLQDKLVKTDAPTTAHLNLNYQSGHKRYIAHILHYIPERRCKELDTIEEVIPLHNVSLKVKLPEKPAKVYCAPSKKELEFEYADGYVSTVIPQVRGHEMIVFSDI